MNDKSRQAMLLAILGLLAIIAVWRFRDLLVPGIGGGGVGAAATDLSPHIVAVKALPEIPVDRPEGGIEYERKRDLFDYAPSPEAAAEALARKERFRQQQADQARRRAEARNRPKPPPKPVKKVPIVPEFDYAYIGRVAEMGDDGSSMAVLIRPNDRRNPKLDKIQVVEVGQELDGKFVIREVGVAELKIGFVDERFKNETKSVPLVQPNPRSGGRRR